MIRRIRPSHLAIIAAVLAAAALVIPALAADPSPGASVGPAATTAASAKPDRSPKPGKGPKADKVPEVEVTITGTVRQVTDADGDVEYTLVAAGKTYRLDAGPSWWWGDANPLKAYVGKSVKVVGEQEQGSDEIDVQSVDGKVVRAKGKPPWAGGWKVVGQKHPGWSAEKAAKHAAKGERGRAAAPGQLKDKTKAEASPSPTP